MVVFSKLLIKSMENVITYEEYFKKKLNLKKFKIPELKEIAKFNKIHVSGTKPVLIERIILHFTQVILLPVKFLLLFCCVLCINHLSLEEGKISWCAAYFSSLLNREPNTSEAFEY